MFKLQWLYITINYFNFWCIKVANRTEGMRRVFPEYKERSFSQVTLVDDHRVCTITVLQCKWSQLIFCCYYSLLHKAMYLLSHHTSTQGFTCTVYRKLLIRAVRDEDKKEWLWSTHAFGCINKNHHTIAHSQSCCYFIREVHMACEERITPFNLCTVLNHD